jgi:ribonuclease HI
VADFLQALAGGESTEAAVARSGMDWGEAKRILSALAEAFRPEAQRAQSEAAAGERPVRIEEVIAYCDGGSRGNPGEAACAAILYDTEGMELLRRARRIGVATNNVAEYESVILALELSGDLAAGRVQIFIDSELVARQLEGVYKVKNAVLQEYHARVSALRRGFRSVKIQRVPRAKTRETDKLVNAALDGKELPEEP